MNIAISLTKKVNYPELGGVMTKKEFIERARAAQWTTQARELNGHQNGEYNRRHFNRLTGDAQKEYEKKLEKVKTVYSIHPPAQSSFYDITASEYQYFQSLENTAATERAKYASMDTEERKTYTNSDR
jgi:hypothetical protein